MPDSKTDESSQNPFTSLALSCLAGWSAMMIAFATWIFVFPHDRDFAPEVGPSGTFVIYGLVFSFFFLLDFWLIVVPYSLLFRSYKRQNLWLRGLLGAVLFSLSVPCWTFAARTSNSGITFLVAFAAAAGAASFISLSN